MLGIGIFGGRNEKDRLAKESKQYAELTERERHLHASLNSARLNMRRVASQIVQLQSDLETLKRNETAYRVELAGIEPEIKRLKERRDDRSRARDAERKQRRAARQAALDAERRATMDRIDERKEAIKQVVNQPSDVGDVADVG